MNDQLQNNQEIEKIAQQHASAFKELSTIESLIIRGHILVEQGLSRAIELTIFDATEYRAEKFTFSQKIILSNMLGISNKFKIELNTLNKLRNQIAHTLTHDDSLVSVIVNEIKAKKSDAIRPNDCLVTQFSSAISFLCGALYISHEQAKIRNALSLVKK